jgi:hypothetical protein
MREKNGQLIEAKAAHETACSKFATAKKVWINYLRFLYGANYKQNMDSEDDLLSSPTAPQKNLQHARELLPRALAALPKRKHIQVINKAATMEFEHGSSERGKSLFEGVLST